MADYRKKIAYNPYLASAEYGLNNAMMYAEAMRKPQYNIENASQDFSGFNTMFNQINQAEIERLKQSGNKAVGRGALQGAKAGATAGAAVGTAAAGPLGTALGAVGGAMQGALIGTGAGLLKRRKIRGAKAKANEQATTELNKYINQYNEVSQNNQVSSYATDRLRALQSQYSFPSSFRSLI